MFAKHGYCMVCTSKNCHFVWSCCMGRAWVWFGPSSLFDGYLMCFLMTASHPSSVVKAFLTLLVVSIIVAAGRNWILSRIFFFTSRNGAITAEERSWRRWWWHGECGWCANLFTEPTLTVALLASVGPLPSPSSSSFFVCFAFSFPSLIKSDTLL